MPRLKEILLGTLLAGAARAHDTVSWATVPASSDSHRLEVMSIPSQPNEEIVTLVSRRDAVVVPAKAPRRVFSVDVAKQTENFITARIPSANTDPEIPTEANWPGIDGRIKETASEAAPAPGRQVLRNPWEVRIRTRVARADSVFVCGGIIAGGDAAPVAFVNGKIERQGDALDGFIVDAVAASAVLLDRNGTKYVLPLGRRTAIANGQP